MCATTPGFYVGIQTQNLTVLAREAFLSPRLLFCPCHPSLISFCLLGKAILHTVNCFEPSNCRYLKDGTAAIPLPFAFVYANAHSKTESMVREMFTSIKTGDFS